MTKFKLKDEEKSVDPTTEIFEDDEKRTNRL